MGSNLTTLEITIRTAHSAKKELMVRQLSRKNKYVDKQQSDYSIFPGKNQFHTLKKQGTAGTRVQDHREEKQLRDLQTTWEGALNWKLLSFENKHTIISNNCVKKIA